MELIIVFAAKFSMVKVLCMLLKLFLVLIKVDSTTNLFVKIFDLYRVLAFEP